MRVAAGLAPEDVHELELLATPPRSRPQLKHRDTSGNLLAGFVYLTGCDQPSTIVAKEYVHRPANLETIPYTQKKVTRGDVLFNHGRWPHGGPGNVSPDQWRYVLFITFTLDEEARKYWSDTEVIRE